MALASGGAAAGDLRHRVNPCHFGLLLATDLAGLASLAADLLTGVADALALVRLGLAGRADLAAIWPTISLSIPTTARRVGFSSSKAMPSGGSISTGWQ